MIWSYWEQGLDAAPPWLQLCHRTVLAHSADHEVITLDRGTVRRYLPMLPDGIDRLPHIASRADILRTRLLERYGGLWLDLDVVGFPALPSVFRLLEQHEFVSTGKHSNDVTMSFMACRPGSALITEWAAAQAKLLSAEEPRTSEWGAFGGPLVREIAHRIGFFDVGPERVVPIGWRDWPQFSSPFGDPRPLLAADPFVVQLFNHEMGPTYQRYSEQQLLRGRRLLSRLFRCSLDADEHPFGDRMLMLGQPIERLYRRARTKTRWLLDRTKTRVGQRRTSSSLRGAPRRTR